jgi:hypothetical protein
MSFFGGFVGGRPAIPKRISTAQRAKVLAAVADGRSFREAALAGDVNVATAWRIARAAGFKGKGQRAHIKEKWATDPEYRACVTAGMKRLWADPERAAKQTAAVRVARWYKPPSPG